MYGKPKDVPGQCNAWMTMGDNYGDGETTCRCQLPEGHKGPHEEHFRTDKEGPDAHKCIIRWDGDDRHQAAWDEGQQKIYSAWEQEQCKAFEAAGMPDDWDWDWDNAPVSDPMPSGFDWRKPPVPKA